MGKNVTEWINQETEADVKLAWGMSLKQENHTLPMIELTFGSQVLPLPQNMAINILLFQVSGKSLKDNIFQFASEKRGKTEDGFASVTDYIEHCLTEDGPYQFLADMLDISYENHGGYDVDVRFHLGTEEVDIMDITRTGEEGFLTVQDWIADEKGCDLRTLPMSLKQENHILPMLSVTFGEQTLPIPQTKAVKLFTTEQQTVSIKDGIYRSFRKDFLWEHPDILSVPEHFDEDGAEPVLAFIEKKLVKDGPYEVLKQVIVHDCRLASTTYFNVKENGCNMEEDITDAVKTGEEEEVEKDNRGG